MDGKQPAPERLIRDRRSTKGLSLSDVAQAIGVSKSMVSKVESGQRHLSPPQSAKLAELLELPQELVEVSMGRLPADVEALLPTQAALVTRLVRQAMPGDYPERLHEGLSDGMEEALRTSALVPGRAPATPLQEEIRTGKNTTAYRTHSYHTKVPPEAITPLIEHHCRPGGVVMDPFSGSGMTGLAALRTGRSGVLSDLSPAAVHISRNYTTPCDPSAFREAVARVERAVGSLMSFLYEVPTTSGERETVEHTVWTDEFRCPHCSAVWTFWEASQRKVGRAAERKVACPRCRKKCRKQGLTWLREVPVVSSTSRSGVQKHDVHPIRETELALLHQAERLPITFWTPTVKFGREREMWRGGHGAMGIESVADFFTPRNLLALAALRHEILLESDPRLREALLFAFTGAVNRASRRYQWNAKRPTNVMSGTLYVSSIRYEWNVWSLFKRKASAVARYYDAFPTGEGRVETVLSSATDLAHVPDNSIDFVFMDPPFGSNIFYADSSLLWEAWLGLLTETEHEIVVNNHVGVGQGGKSVEDYGALLESSFAEVRRALKPGSAAVLAFSNTNDAVWQSIQGALTRAGFEVHETAVLDKVHHSIKGIQGALGHEQVTRLDLLVTLRQRTGAPTAMTPIPKREVRKEVGKLVAAYLGRVGEAGADTDAIYTDVVRRLLEQGRAVRGVPMSLVDEVCRSVAVRGEDGRWRLPALSDDRRPYVPVDSPYGCLADTYIARARSFEPMADGCTPKEIVAPLTGAVAGTRNTAFYNAHSYHTKVPPEAITPFIEHHTRPGDVVLDPFCGSGMTGLAAAITGRRAILNDLSVISSHLAYNHTRPCDPRRLKREFAALYAELRPKFANLYRTTSPDGRTGYVHYTIWSKVYRCPTCAERFSMWDVVDTKTGRIGSTMPCPACGAVIKRQGLRPEANEPVMVNYEVEGSGRRRRKEHAATSADLEHIATFRSEDVDGWYPRVEVGASREMYQRSALHLQKVQHVADFYTPRNLLALSLLWERIQAVEDERIKHVLAFAFTNTAWHGTRMRRFNARGGQRPLTGTLYIPQLSSEVNVLEVMKNKVSQLATFYRAFQPAEDVPLPLLSVGSATALVGVPDGSVDYVFTDPPFGSNIFYADCNLIWESWLGGITDDRDEAVVNRSRSGKHGGKSIADYRGLMTEALAEMHRVLKPGGWATLVFHNTDAEVWKALQDAAARAGFVVEDAAALDRKEQSHKGYKGKSGKEDVAHFDVVLSMRKVAPGIARERVVAVDDELLLSQLLTLLADDDRIGVSLQWAHSCLIRSLLASDHDLSDVSYARVREIWTRSVRVRDREDRKPTDGPGTTAEERQANLF